MYKPRKINVLKYSSVRCATVTVHKIKINQIFQPVFPPSLSLRTPLPTRGGVRELRVLLLPGDCRGAQQPGQGKAACPELSVPNMFPPTPTQTHTHTHTCTPCQPTSFPFHECKRFVAFQGSRPSGHPGSSSPTHHAC